MKMDYRGVTVILDREDGTNVERSINRYAELIMLLEPLKKRGLRVRIAAAPSTFEQAYELKGRKKR